MLIFLMGGASLVSAETNKVAPVGKRPTELPPIPKLQTQEANQNRLGNSQNKAENRIIQRPMIMGIVTNIEGGNVTIESNIVNPKEKEGEKKISYVADVSKALFYEAKQIVSLSNVEKGDKIMIEGEVKENNIMATRVHIGDFSAWKNPNVGIKEASGEPLVVAKVKAVDEENKTLTITNKQKETYTVKLDEAKIVKNGEDSGLDKISKNDVVLVQGEINENTVDASTVSVQSKNSNGERVQILKRVGDFFSRLFKSKK